MHAPSGNCDIQVFKTLVFATYNMDIQHMKALVCVFTFIYPIMCTKTSVKFRAVSSFQGQVIIETIVDSVFVCMSDCSQHRPTCQGVMYHAASKECRLLGSNSNAPTLTFNPSVDWTLHTQVSMIYLNKVPVTPNGDASAFRIVKARCGRIFRTLSHTGMLTLQRLTTRCLFSDATGVITAGRAAHSTLHIRLTNPRRKTFDAYISNTCVKTLFRVVK